MKKCSKHNKIIWGWLLCSMIGLLFAGCEKQPQLQAEKIAKIDITIVNTVEGNTSFSVTQPENIVKAVDIGNQMQNYRSSEIDTWFVDVLYNITNADGSSRQIQYNNIRPYTDIFAPLFQTLEVRRQREYILYTDTVAIKNAVISSPSKGSMIIDAGSQKELLQQIVESLKEFYNTERTPEEAPVYNNAKGLEISFNNGAGRCLVYGADTQTCAILAKAGILSQLTVEADDIVSMVVHKDGHYVEITDPALQEIVLSSYYEGWSAQESTISVEYTLKNTKGSHLDQYGSFYKGKVPAEIAALFA